MQAVTRKPRRSLHRGMSRAKMSHMEWHLSPRQAIGAVGGKREREVHLIGGGLQRRRRPEHSLLLHHICTCR